VFVDQAAVSDFCTFIEEGVLQVRGCRFVRCQWYWFGLYEGKPSKVVFSECEFSDEIPGSMGTGIEKGAGNVLNPGVGEVVGCWEAVAFDPGCGLALLGVCPERTGRETGVETASESRTESEMESFEETSVGEASETWGESALPTRTGGAGCEEGTTYFGVRGRHSVFAAGLYCFVECVFEDLTEKENNSEADDRKGAAVLAWNEGGRFQFEYCGFLRCVVERYGGALALELCANVSLCRCCFVACSAEGTNVDGGGGGVMFGQPGDGNPSVTGDSVTLEQCSFGGCSTGAQGGAVLWRQVQGCARYTNFTECLGGVGVDDGGGGAFVFRYAVAAAGRVWV
jgi:hypothetical protein